MNLLVLIMLKSILLVSSLKNTVASADKKKGIDSPSAVKWKPQHEIMYKMNYDTFFQKQKRMNRIKRTIFPLWEFNYQIESVDVKLNWGNFYTGKRIGSGFLLKKGQNIVENLVLYAPRDRSYTVRELLDASGYLGQIRIIKSKEEISKFNVTRLVDFLVFKIDTPRIIPERESKHIINALSRLPETDVKLDSVSVELKLPSKYNTNMALEVKSVSSNFTVPRALIHIAPRMSTVRINNLPSHSVVKLSLKTNNSTRKTDVNSVFLFTGSVLSLRYNAPHTSPSNKITSFRKDGTKIKVTCFVENKAPFQGFPCKGSDVCIPLHWECDGEEDCQDGFDELKCPGVLSSQHVYKPMINRCRRNEFQCVAQNKVSCIQPSWLCDGFKDCIDGSDEGKNNCKYPISHFHLSNQYSEAGCKKNYFRCRRSGCVPQRLVCDGHYDCTDGSDEYECPDEGEDEFNSQLTCDSEYEFKCFRSNRGRKCVPRPWMCDDQDDCPSGEDEDDDICQPLFESRKKSAKLQ